MTGAIKFILLGIVGFPALAQSASPNWTGPYSPCRRHSDLLRYEHIDLGVRISTSNAVLAEQFERALDFWAGVLDLGWHEVDSDDCAIQLVDGIPGIFESDACRCTAARSQYPDRSDFQGWIAFNPALEFTPAEMFRDSIHEIGHLFGLPHNASSSSVMFFSDFDQNVSLDAADLEALLPRHKLRAYILAEGIANAVIMVPPTGARGAETLPPLAVAAP